MARYFNGVAVEARIKAQQAAFVMAVKHWANSGALRGTSGVCEPQRAIALAMPDIAAFY